jgi:DNA-binding transcriptional regulator LsrR (DeoR family)
MKQKLSEQQEKEITENITKLYNEGLKRPHIAKKLNIGLPAVDYICGFLNRAKREQTIKSESKKTDCLEELEGNDSILIIKALQSRIDSFLDDKEPKLVKNNNPKSNTQLNEQKIIEDQKPKKYVFPRKEQLYQRYGSTKYFAGYQDDGKFKKLKQRKGWI